MPYYEIVIQGKGTGDPVVSPTTYAALEEAEAALAPVLDVLESKGFLRLSWYGADAANINRAFVSETDQLRPSDPRTPQELVEDMNRLLGSSAESARRS